MILLATAPAVLAQVAPLAQVAQSPIIEADSVNLGTLMLRVLFGLTFAAHGYAKFFQGGRIAGTAGWFDSMGMRPGKVHALAAATTELGAGLLLALGLLTPFAAMAMVGTMVVAGWTVHRNNGFFIVKEGWEYTFVAALIAVAVATIGPGEWSLDNQLGLDGLHGVWGLLIAGVGGAAAGVTQMAMFYRPNSVSSS